MVQDLALPGAALLCPLLLAAAPAEWVRARAAVVAVVWVELFLFKAAEL